MTNRIISEATLQQIKLTPSELLIEMATYLYDKERLTKMLAGLNQNCFSKGIDKAFFLQTRPIHTFFKSL